MENRKRGITWVLERKLSERQKKKIRDLFDMVMVMRNWGYNNRTKWVNALKYIVFVAAFVAIGAAIGHSCYVHWLNPNIIICKVLLWGVK